MSDHPSIEFEENWLPDDFKPMTFRSMCFNKIKNAPVAAAGAAATVGALCMSGYCMRLGNSARFNYWLRVRVGAQAFTVCALVYYGGAALNREKQEQQMRKQLVMLGELPADTPILKVPNDVRWSWAKDTDREERAAAYREAVLAVQSTYTYQPPEEDQIATNESARHLALPLEDRIRAAEFNARLRAAEQAQAEDDEDARNRKEGRQSVSYAGDLLTKRMEQAADRKKGSTESIGARTTGRTMNKHRLAKEAAAREEQDRLEREGQEVKEDDVD